MYFRGKRVNLPSEAFRPFYPQFPQNLRSLRTERGLTQQQLADLTGTAKITVYHWESGAALPQYPMLLRLANLFEIPMKELLGQPGRPGQSKHNASKGENVHKNGNV